jgi:hypothetical protein
MKEISIGLSVAAFVSGVLSAWYWYRASKFVFYGGIPPWTAPANSQKGVWQIINQLREGSGFNKRAALWTAATAFLGGANSLLSALTSN